MAFVPRPPSLPMAFRAPRGLRCWNVLATATCLAAVAGAAANHAYSSLQFGGAETAVSTLAFGVVGANLVRRASTKRAVALSFVLAPLDLCVAFFLPVGNGVLAKMSLRALADCLMVSAYFVSVGAIFWLPGLAFAWLVFGLPILRTRRVADRGLGHEDRGECTVALLAALAAVGTLFWMWFSPYVAPIDSYASMSPKPWPYDALFVEWVAGAGIVLGVVGAVIATQRERARRRFLASVRTGYREGYRIERQTNGSEALVRVRMSKEGYRIGPFVEEIVVLDEGGDAVGSAVA